MEIFLLFLLLETCARAASSQIQALAVSNSSTPTQPKAKVPSPLTFKERFPIPDHLSEIIKFSTPLFDDWPAFTTVLFNIFVFMIKWIFLEDDLQIISDHLANRAETFSKLWFDCKHFTQRGKKKMKLVFQRPVVARCPHSDNEGAIVIASNIAKGSVGSYADQRLTIANANCVCPSPDFLPEKCDFDIKTGDTTVNHNFILSRGTPSFQLTFSESLIIAYELKLLPVNKKRLWLQYIQPLLCCSPHWILANSIINGLKNIPDVKKYIKRFQEYISFLEHQWFDGKFLDILEILRNPPPFCIGAWVNNLVCRVKVSTIRGYVSSVNYFLRKLDIPPLQQLQPSVKDIIEGWRKQLASEEGESATKALTWDQTVVTFEIAKTFFSDETRFSPTCYSALIISYWAALRTTEARELTTIQCALGSNSSNFETLILSLWEPKTVNAKQRRRHQHVIVGSVSVHDYAFCPLRHFQKILSCKIEGQITLFADADGFPFFDYEFYSIWREFFAILKSKLLLQGKYSFYTFRSSCIVNFSVNFHMSEEEIKCVSRHTVNSKVLQQYYLAKDIFGKKISSALTWAEKFNVQDARNLQDSIFPKFFSPNEWFEDNHA